MTLAKTILDTGSTPVASTTLIGEKMVIIKLKHGEPFEKAMRRFKRKVETEGVMKEIKKRKFYMTKSEKRKDKRKKAEKRRRKLLNRK